jgi:hypothetical protein
MCEKLKTAWWRICEKIVDPVPEYARRNWKLKKNSCSGNLSSTEYSNPGPLEYEGGVLTTQLWLLIVSSLSGSTKSDQYYSFETLLTDGMTFWILILKRSSLFCMLKFHPSSAVLILKALKEVCNTMNTFATQKSNADLNHCYLRDFCLHW